MSAKQLAKVLPHLMGDVAQDLPVNLNTTNSLVSISDTERDRITARIAGSQSRTQEINEASLRSHIGALVQMAGDSKLEYAEIIKMSPEVAKAISIVVPSIISPNDLKNGSIGLTLELPQVEESQRNAITKALLDHLEAELKISKNLPKWIENAMYRSGAQVFMMIPYSELDRLLQSEDKSVEGSMESLLIDLYDRNDKTSLFGIGDDPEEGFITAMVKEGKDDLFNVAMESFVSELSTDENTPAQIRSKSYDNSTSAFEAFANKVLSKEAFKISDNPDDLRRGSARTRAAARNITDKIKSTYYSVQPIVTLDNVAGSHDPDLGKAPVDQKGEPLWMELPMESVIPLYEPGSPEKHIGYFIAVDTDGVPITAELKEFNNYNMPSAQLSTVDALYRAFGFNEQARQSSPHAMMTSAIYQKVIEMYVARRMQSKGFRNIAIGSDQSLFRCMFQRYLQNHYTKLVFVPKEFITYFCYKHNQFGMGESKLEDIKFALSLKIMILVSNTIAELNNSINRKTINVNMPQNAAITNPMQLISDITNDFIAKERYPITHNPRDIAEVIERKGISVKLKNVQGLADFDMTTEMTEGHTRNISDGLVTIVDDMLQNGLDAPPAAMNKMAEEEFATSIATTNILYSRFIQTKQEVTCDCMTDSIQKYAVLSPTCVQKIEKILNGDDKEIGKDTGTIVENKVSVWDVIHALKVTLPTPNIAPDKALYEELDKFLQTIQTIVEAIYPNELVNGDTELSDVWTALRATIKTDLIREHLQKIGLGQSITLPTPVDMQKSEIFTMHQVARNIKQGLKLQKKANGENPDDMSGGGSFGGSDSYGSDTTGAPGGEEDTDNTDDEMPTF